MNSIIEMLCYRIGSSPIAVWHLLVVFVLLAPLILLFTFYRKQWDRIPGVWRCVILSGIAHVVLVFYLYGTQYVVFSGPGRAAEPIAIQIVDEEPVSSEPQDLTHIPAWDRFTNEQLVPDVDPLVRPMEEPELVLEHVFAPPISDDAVQPEIVMDAESQNIEREAIVREVIENIPLASETDEPIDAPQLAVQEQESSELQDMLPDSVSPDAPAPLEVSRPEAVASEQPSFEGTLSPSLESPFAVEMDIPVDANPSPTFAETESNVDDLAMEATPIELPVELPQQLLDSVPSELSGYIREPATEKVDVIPRRLGDSQPMPRVYSRRAPEGRLEIVRSRGGSVETEAAVERALAFLVSQQWDDGRWSSRETGGGIERNVFGHDRKGAGATADTGITGLSVLAFLASGNTQYEGIYRENVKRAISFLSSQQDSVGCLAGGAKDFERMYCHSMSMLALSEALAVTGDPDLLPVVQRAVNYSVNAQNKNDGGWRYKPSDTGDMSQFGWQVLSLHSANLGGIEIPNETIQGMQRFLIRCTKGRHGGLGCYRPEEGPSVTMTAEALAVRYLLQEDVDESTLNEAATAVLQHKPSLNEINYYYWYYGTMAMSHAGGEYWSDWNAQLKSTLLPHQISSGPDSGSWPADGLWSGYGGKVYSTALATLCLESYYRFVPISELNAAANQ
ncbi:MAG: prenyltransferase/squalene oxidase repeat-containing protein [Pirellulaceae bacterium]